MDHWGRVMQHDGVAVTKMICVCSEREPDVVPILMDAMWQCSEWASRGGRSRDVFIVVYRTTVMNDMA